ncbi:hypothetical protein M9434_005042 [Picochlorum sp. BPE23]|nr:hypothetical protein M9434_005042 [Picochlorum sp. BPE23]
MTDTDGYTRRSGALLGPRVIGRLTPELVLRSPQYMNCIDQYELDLRGNSIAILENLGTTENQFDSIDVSDNAITKLDGFPKLRRLSSLHMNNNRIERISDSLGEALPNLELLILTNNKLSDLVTLEPLGLLGKLTYLSLVDNPVTKEPGYRLFIISRCKKLKMLDYRKVTASEREQAEKEFGNKAAPAPRTRKEKESTKGSRSEPSTKKGPSREKLMAIKAAIASASTMEEVAKLEERLQQQDEEMEEDQ